MDFYFATFERVRKLKPVFGAREGKSAKKLLEALGLEASKHRIEGTFADSWHATRATINEIAANPDRFPSKAPPAPKPPPETPEEREERHRKQREDADRILREAKEGNGIRW